MCGRRTQHNGTRGQGQQGSKRDKAKWGVDAQCGKRALPCKRDAAFIFFGRSHSILFLILFIQVEVQLGLILATHPLTNSMAIRLRRGDHAPRAMGSRPAARSQGRELSVWALRLDICVYLQPSRDKKGGGGKQVLGGGEGGKGRVRPLKRYKLAFLGPRSTRACRAAAGGAPPHKPCLRWRRSAECMALL